MEQKTYDLEERTFVFAQNVRSELKNIPKTIISYDDCKQLTRSSGSVGANYIEANDSLGKKDFQMRIRICRKEAKESIYWLRLLQTTCPEAKVQLSPLIQEAKELMLIFGSILQKYNQKQVV